MTRNVSSVDLRVISCVCTTPEFRNEVFLKHLYEVEKLSARQIAVLTGCGHSTINEALRRYGIDRQIRRGGQSPFGYKRSIGKLVPDSRQQRVLHKIQTKASAGWSPNKIATWLNSSRI